MSSNKSETRVCSFSLVWIYWRNQLGMRGLFKRDWCVHKTKTNPANYSRVIKPLLSRFQVQKHYLTEKSWLAGHRLVLLGHIPSHHERRWAKPPHQSSESRYMCSDAITSHGPACVGSAVVTRLPRTPVVSGSNPDAAKDMLY